MKWSSPTYPGRALELVGDKLSDGTDLYDFVEPDIPYLVNRAVMTDFDDSVRNFYEGRVDGYEQNLHLTFHTFNVDEKVFRNALIDELQICRSSRILEIACGTGRDSVLLASRLGQEGELWLTDISPGMVSYTKEKLERENVECEVNYAVSSAMSLPCPDDYFDAIYCFGAAGEFSDPKRFFQEVVRVAKTGCKVVVGDENLPVWQRDTLFGKVIANYNKQFLEPVPFDQLPIEAREVCCRWVLGEVFYVLSFSVGKGELRANFDFEIPGVRGGTHMTRFYGQLEGVTPEAKDLAIRMRDRLNISMHQLLDELIKREAKKILDGGEC